MSKITYEEWLKTYIPVKYGLLMSERIISEAAFKTRIERQKSFHDSRIQEGEKVLLTNV